MIPEVVTQVGRGDAPPWVVVSIAVNSARLIVVNHFDAAQALMGETLVGGLLGLAAEQLSRPESTGDPRGFYLFGGLYRYVGLPVVQVDSSDILRAIHVYSCSSYVPIFVLSLLLSIHEVLPTYVPGRHRLPYRSTKLYLQALIYAFFF